MAQEKSDERVVTSDMVKMEQALENNEPIEVVDAEVVEEKPKKKATKKTEEVQEEMVQKWNGVLPNTVVGEDFAGLLNIGQ